MKRKKLVKRSYGILCKNRNNCQFLPSGVDSQGNYIPYIDYSMFKSYNPECKTSSKEYVDLKLPF